MSKLTDEPRNVPKVFWSPCPFCGRSWTTTHLCPDMKASLASLIRRLPDAEEASEGPRGLTAEQMQGASARETLARMPVIDDPAISESMRDLEASDEGISDMEGEIRHLVPL